jgi:hypothetical protein
MKCPVCRRAKCVWVELKSNPEKQSLEHLEKVVNHNLSYIDMIFSGHGGSAHAEERMFTRLAPYTDEIESRKKRPPLK